MGGERHESQWQTLATEARNPRSLALDTLSSEEVVALLLEEDRAAIANALERRSEIALAADQVAKTLAGGGDVVLAGAGTSGRLGVLEAAECPPTFGTDPQRIRAVMAGGREAVFASREGAEDVEEDGHAVGRVLRSGDLLIAISASSVTPFARGALRGARAAGARTVLVTGTSSHGLGELADLVIALATGAEVLTGSTRLKAGSATKATLNAITTTAMVRLGKVYENLMVDVRPASAKLRDRAARIVAEAGRVERELAENLLGQAAGEVKVAIVMARLGVDAAAARQRLTDSAGRVRAAIDTGGGE